MVSETQLTFQTLYRRFDCIFFHYDALWNKIFCSGVAVHSSVSAHARLQFYQQSKKSYSRNSTDYIDAHQSESDRIDCLPAHIILGIILRPQTRACGIPVRIIINVVILEVSLHFELKGLFYFFKTQVAKVLKLLKSVDVHIRATESRTKKPTKC